MQQSHPLINGFCEAVSQWAEITEQPAYGPIYYWILARLGAGWSKDRDTEFGLLPDYETELLTIDDLRQYLTALVEGFQLWEDFIILGLAQSVEYELAELLKAHDSEAIQEQQLRITNFRYVANDPAAHAEVWEGLRRNAAEMGLPHEDGDIRSALLGLANLSERFLMEKLGRGQVAYHKDMLSSWRELIGPIISPDSLAKWRDEYFAFLGTLTSNTRSVGDNHE